MKGSYDDEFTFLFPDQITTDDVSVIVAKKMYFKKLLISCFKKIIISLNQANSETDDV